MAVLPAISPLARSQRTRRDLRVVVNANASGAATAVPTARLVAALREAGADVELERTGTLDELAAVWRLDDGRRVVLVGAMGPSTRRPTSAASRATSP